MVTITGHSFTDISPWDSLLALKLIVGKDKHLWQLLIIILIIINGTWKAPYDEHSFKALYKENIKTTKYREIAITKGLYITKHNYNTLKLQFVQPIRAKIKNIH